MLDIKKLADEADVIVQGYAFIAKGEGITIIDLHRPEHAAYFYNDELVETSMDEIEAFKVTKLYKDTMLFLIMTHLIL